MKRRKRQGRNNGVKAEKNDIEKKNYVTKKKILTGKRNGS